MIFVNKQDTTEAGFISLLEKTKEGINHEFLSKGIPKKITGVEFENIVFHEMIKASANSNFQGYIEQTGSFSFPDIIARELYGVEVKMTLNNKWTSIGNSVLETTRKEGVETIYIFFGKFGESFQARYKKYQDCLYEVGVTHSPRYKIDMDLPEGYSIFNKIGISYDIFRKEQSPIKLLQEYYKKQLKAGEELWWIPTSEENFVSPVIKSFRLLDRSIKEQFLLESMILFPEIFGKSSMKFERAAAYLMTGYNAFSSNLRDIFTAGGKKSIIIDGKSKIVEQVLYRLFLRSKEIIRVIKKISKDKLAYYWNIEIKKDPLEIWQELLKNYSKLAVIIFNNGLEPS